MSVKVDLDRLTQVLAGFGSGYLITVSDEHRAHTVAVDPVLAGGVIDIGSAGNSTRRNIAAHPAVTLLWPPLQPGGYTLIVDGRGSVEGETLHVVPERAVLHRKTSNANDCVPLDN